MPTDTAPVALRAKFRCLTVTPNNVTTPPTCVNLLLQAVSADGADNASWAAATPAGSLSLGITNPRAFDALVAGQDYYLDLTAVPPAASNDEEDADDTDEDVSSGRRAAVSADAGNLITIGSDGLAFLSTAALKNAIAPTPVNVVLNGVDGIALGVIQAPAATPPAAPETAVPAPTA